MSRLIFLSHDMFLRVYLHFFSWGIWYNRENKILLLIPLPCLVFELDLTK